MRTGFGLGIKMAVLLMVATSLVGCATSAAAPTATLGQMVSVATPPPEPKVPEVGGIAPDFALEDLNGDRVRLTDYRGKVVLLNFWATWCPPCQHEVPMFVKVYDELKDDDFVIVAVSIGEARERVVSFASEKKMSFPVLLDSNKIVGRQYLVRAIPTSLVIDRTGVVRRIFVGMMQESQLRAELKDLL